MNVIAVTGAIGAGKTTLAARLAANLDALHLASDAVRLSLSAKQRGNGHAVFGEFHRRFDLALKEGRTIVLDSTGMSPRFRALLRTHRREIVHVHLLLCDPERFDRREAQRTDRPDGALPYVAFARSRNVEFHDAPDLTIETDDLTPDEVYERVAAFVRL